MIEPTDISQPQNQQLKYSTQSFPECQQQENDEACILVRDLDSGVSSCVDPATLLNVTELATPRKGSSWDDYWNQRQNNKHMLLKLVNCNQSDKLMELLQHKSKQIDINQFIYLDGWTLMHHAIGKKFYDVVAVLIQNGCSLNKPTQFMRRTPLHIAVLEKQQQIIQLLLQHKADLNALDIDFCTPVHYAAEFGYLDIFKILLNYEGINFSIKNNKKMTAIDCCRDTRMRQMIKQYCQMHQCKFQQSQFYSRTMDTDNRPIFHVRNRSDFIERILYQNPRLVESDSIVTQPEQCYITKKKYSSSTATTLGSKINKEKFERASLIAKKSLCSYKDSLVINTTQSLDNYQIFRKLGSGTFGTVFLIRKKQSSKLFAMKRLSKKLLTDNKMKKYAFAERQILKTMNHPFILHAHSFFQDNSYLYMVMDFCAGGDLERIVRKNKFDEQKAKKYACEVILALQQLHKHNYLFRDLKVSNVLLDQFGHIRLADFGLAKQSEVSHSFLGSVAYLAPEMLVDTDNKPHTAAIDWYLLGVFVFEMLTGLPPFYNQNRIQMFEQIKKNKPKIPSNVSPQCKDFLSKTLNKKPNQRLGYNGAFQIKQHAWFKDIDWKSVLQKELKMQPPQINQKQLRQRQFIEEEQVISQKTENNGFKGWDFCER